ncbi:MAG: cation:proton antiporter [Candidatus Njordarchaeales archaeon]
MSVSEIGYYVFLYALALMFSLLMGEILRRKDQSEVLGQILVGVIFGPYLLGIFKPNEFFTFISEIGALTLLFIAGLETDLKTIMKSGPVSFILAITSILLTFAFAFPITYILSRDIILALFVSVTLGATSISLTVRIFDEFGKLGTRLAHTIVISAVFDDLLVMILAVLVIDFARAGSFTWHNMLKTITNVAVFFIVTAFFMLVFMKYIDDYILRFQSKGAVLIFAFSFALLYGFFASLIGLSPIIGAYFAGVIIAESDIEVEIIEAVSPIAFVTVPIFLVNIGLKFNLEIITNVFLLGGLLSIIAISGKILSGFPANILAKGRRVETVLLGASIMPRGEVALVLAGIGLELGILNDAWFSSIVFVMIVTTLITPVILKTLLKRIDFSTH